MEFVFLLLIFKLAISLDGAEGSSSVNIGLKVYNGFPFQIACDQFQFQDYEYGRCMYGDCPNAKEEVQCVIMINGETLFDETFAMRDLSTKGFFEIADKSWNRKNISIFVQKESDSGPTEFVVKVKVFDPVEKSCYDDQEDTERLSVYVGEDLGIGCFAPEEMRMSEEQFDSITTVWYHGCTRIARNDPRYEYGKAQFFGGRYIPFESLMICNASLSTTPGKYRCVLERQGARLLAVNYQVCLREHTHLNLPAIAADRKKYEVRAGSSLTATCSGKTGTKSNSLSQTLMWYKNEDNNLRPRCFDVVGNSFKNRDCSSILPGGKIYCEPLSAAQIDEVKKRELDDSFIASYTLRNVTKADGGLYTCVLRTTRGRISSNFSIVVRDKTNIALVDKASLRYIASIVYSEDVFKGLENKMLQDTDRNSKLEDRQVYGSDDQTRFFALFNKTLIKRTLKRCATVVLFVTPQLLADREMGGDELEDILLQLQESIENSDMNFVFILTKGTKKQINTRAIKGNKVSVKLSGLMRSERATVVIQKPKPEKEFVHALTYALPGQEMDPPVVFCFLFQSSSSRKV